MASKDSNPIQQFTNFVEKNPDKAGDVLSQFKNVDAETLTQPSIILKGGIEELDVQRISPKTVEQYLLAHPVIPRGIEIKANRMTGRGYHIVPADEDDVEAQRAAEKMEELLQDSGDEILINGWIKDAYAFGNGYLTLLPADNGTGQIVYLVKEHPMFFRIAREKKENSDSDSRVRAYLNKNSNKDFSHEWGEMKIDPITKKPEAYTQVVFADSGDDKVEPIGDELNSDQVAHLVFDSWGDEAQGIGLIQYVHTILKYLMNIEEAGAEAIYRSGFTQKKVTTEINSEKDLKKLANELKDINASDALILPEGTDVENLQPGQTQFEEVHDIFLNLIAIRLGIPKPILTLDGTDTNKATMRELMRDLIWDIHADELKVQRTIEEQIFEPACKSLFGEQFVEDGKVPFFRFNDFEESQEEKANVMNMTADYVKKLTESYKILSENGQQEMGEVLLDYMRDTLPKDNLIVDEEKKNSDMISEETEEEPEEE